MVSKEQRFIKRMSKQQPMMVTEIGTNMVLPNHSGTKKEPVLDGEIATKKYVDDNAGGGAPEGTSVKSTGEAGGVKFLREDGDGTCSWNKIDISDNTNLVAGTNITLSGDTLNVDDAFIKNDADDTSTGKITAANFAVTGDNNTNDTAYVPMVLHGTDATPPTASNVPRGTIYIQYTA